MVSNVRYYSFKESTCTAASRSGSWWRSSCGLKFVIAEPQILLFTAFIALRALGPGARGSLGRAEGQAGAGGDAGRESGKLAINRVAPPTA